MLGHPLRKYPGPFIATLTDGYNGYYASKKRLHLATLQDHIKYGIARQLSSMIPIWRLKLADFMFVAVPQVQ